MRNGATRHVAVAGGDIAASRSAVVNRPLLDDDRRRPDIPRAEPRPTGLRPIGIGLG